MAAYTDDPEPAKASSAMQQKGCLVDTCSCVEFVGNQFKRYQCMDCFHGDDKHVGLTPKEEALAALARDDSSVNDVWKGRIFMGSMFTATKRQLLKDAGITHIVCCCPTAVEVWPKWKPAIDGFERLELRMVDSGTSRLAPFLRVSTPWIDAALSQTDGDIEANDSQTSNHSNRVFVHCARGVSRSGAVVLAYLMQQQGLTFDQALSTVREGRAVVTPNVGFSAELKELEKTGFAALLVDDDGDSESKEAKP